MGGCISILIRSANDFKFGIYLFLSLLFSILVHCTSFGLSCPLLVI